MIETLIMEGKNKFKKTQYESTCKFKIADCIYDPAYIKATYPLWYEELKARPGCLSCDYCKNGDKYDDEDK